MKDSAKYARIVEWSEEDQYYVGSAPGLFLDGCHGDNEQEVFAELCQIVDETIELYLQDRKPLPDIRTLYQQLRVLVDGEDCCAPISAVPLGCG